MLSPSLAATPVVVIAATNRPDAVDPAVLRRLPLSFQIDLPGLHAREEVPHTLRPLEPAQRMQPPLRCCHLLLER